MYVPILVHDKAYAEFAIICSFHHVRDIGIYFCVKGDCNIIFTFLFSVFLLLEDIQNLLNTFTLFPPVSSKLGQ